MTDEQNTVPGPTTLQVSLPKTRAITETEADCAKQCMHSRASVLRAQASRMSSERLAFEQRIVADDIDYLADSLRLRDGVLVVEEEQANGS